MSIKQFLADNNIESIKQMDLDSPFKNYRPLDKGNVKLDKSILSFSLLPYVTCPMKCKNCYDLKSLRFQDVKQKRLYNTYMAINKPDELKALIIKQIVNSRSVKFIRIHVGGDFFSADYVNMWLEIVKLISTIKPDVKFYSYTKTEYLDSLVTGGINIVQSILPDGSFNYGKLEDLQRFIRHHKEYSICPAYKHDDSVICGKTCQLCMNKTRVLFVQH